MTFSLSQIANGITRLQKLTKDLGEVELREEVLAQRELLLSAKEEILRLREANSELESSLKEMQSTHELLDGSIEVDGFRYDSPHGTPLGLPYCPLCEVESKRLYRLTRLNERYSRCPKCKNEYNAGKDGRVHESAPPTPSTWVRSIV